MGNTIAATAPRLSSTTFYSFLRPRVARMMTRMEGHWIRLDRLFSATVSSQIGHPLFDSHPHCAGADVCAPGKAKLEKVRGRVLTTKEAKHTKRNRARNFRVVRFFRGQLLFRHTVESHDLGRGRDCGSIHWGTRSVVVTVSPLLDDELNGAPEHSKTFSQVVNCPFVPGDRSRSSKRETHIAMSVVLTKSPRRLSEK